MYGKDLHPMCVSQRFLKNILTGLPSVQNLFLIIFFIETFWSVTYSQPIIQINGHFMMINADIDSDY